MCSVSREIKRVGSTEVKGQELTVESEQDTCPKFHEAARVINNMLVVHSDWL